VASSTVTFFRSLGGAIGVSVFGSVLASRVAHHARQSITLLSPLDQRAGARASTYGAIPEPRLLSADVRVWLEDAYGHGIADIFWYCLPVGCAALAVTLFIRETPLRASHRPVRQSEGTGANAIRRDVLTLCEIGSGTDDGDVGPVTVRGHVRAGTGAVVPGSIVTLVSSAGRQVGQAVTLSDGAYTVDAPGTGLYVIVTVAGDLPLHVAPLMLAGGPVSYDVLLDGGGG
jgi:multidrug efflux pump subunit AcrA (membrane-fusion protein)